MALTKRRDEQFIFAERRASSVGIVKDTMPPKTGRGCKLSIKLNHVQLKKTEAGDPGIEIFDQQILIIISI